ENERLGGRRRARRDRDLLDQRMIVILGGELLDEGRPRLPIGVGPEWPEGTRRRGRIVGNDVERVPAAEAPGPLWRVAPAAPPRPPRRRPGVCGCPGGDILGVLFLYALPAVSAVSMIVVSTVGLLSGWSLLHGAWTTNPPKIPVFGSGGAVSGASEFDGSPLD